MPDRLFINNYAIVNSAFLNMLRYRVDASKVPVLRWAVDHTAKCQQDVPCLTRMPAAGGAYQSLTEPKLSALRIGVRSGVAAVNHLRAIQCFGRGDLQSSTMLIVPPHRGLDMGCLVLARNDGSHAQKQGRTVAASLFRDDPTTGATAMGIFKDGWDAFVTPVREFNDGDQSCEAELQATNNATGHTITYYGSTQNLHGHAEIDALYQFLKSIGWNVANFNGYTLTIHCTAKPCCKYCASVMGNLGIFATGGTFKSTKSMGISYALPYEVRNFLRNILVVTNETILSELSQ